MRLYTEFIVLYEDMPMPTEEMFCPSFWKADDFDAGGDYYAEGIDGRWTHLELTRRQKGAPESTLGVYTHREKNIIESGLQETADLQRYIDYKTQGRYRYEEPLAQIQSLAVTSLCFDTPSVEDYREFLTTVHNFLLATKGQIINYSEILDAELFAERFLQEDPGQYIRRNGL
ncbi:MAG: hypothetical protein MJE77_25070 [Proteobacteria bacterium]|nr:hypothetical protein [Pseudomonadota bacterium]